MNFDRLWQSRHFLIRRFQFISLACLYTNCAITTVFLGKDCSFGCLECYLKGIITSHCYSNKLETFKWGRGNMKWFFHSAMSWGQGPCPQPSDWHLRLCPAWVSLNTWVCELMFHTFVPQTSSSSSQTSFLSTFAI
jgi:hypothetical protein